MPYLTCQNRGKVAPYDATLDFRAIFCSKSGAGEKVTISSTCDLCSKIWRRQRPVLKRCYYLWQGQTVGEMEAETVYWLLTESKKFIYVIDLDVEFL